MRIIALFFLIPLSGCSSIQTIVIFPSNAGSVESQSTVHPLFAAYLADMETVLGSVFDPQSIKSALELLPVSRVSVEKDNRDYGVGFYFLDIASLVQASGYQFISFQQQGDQMQMEVELHAEDISNFMQLYADTGPFDFLLAYGQEDYLSRLEWALSDYGGAEELQQMMESFVVDLQVQTPGRILYQQGGTMRGENRIDYRISLLELLEQPFLAQLHYRVNQ